MKKNIKKIKSIAVLCSGGDAPGMNPAIRAVVRSAIGHDLKIWGIRRGYLGLIEGNMEKMGVSDVGNIIQRGGTVLQTSRCPEFMKKEGRKKAIQNLLRNKIDGLVVIGGNGSFNGAMKFFKETQFPVVGVPGTIDNDISGTEYTIGFNTAVQNAIDAIDKIRDTASSHARTFLVEVMGRSAPAIASMVGLCTGAENIILPGKKGGQVQIAKDIKRGVERGKNSSIIIVAEGHTPGTSYQLQEYLKKEHNISSHVAILGYIQRGGNPTAIDRFVASQMGALAVEALIKKNYPSVTTMNKGKIMLTPLKSCLKNRQIEDEHFYELIKKLSI